MPKVIIEVSDTWHERHTKVIAHAIDTLQGMEHQCRNSDIEGRPEPEELIEQLHSQLIDLRRNLEAIRLIF